MLKTCNKPLKDSEVHHDKSHNDSLEFFAQAIADLKKCKTTQELLLLEYIKFQIFEMSAVKDTYNAQQSLLKPNLNTLAAIPSGHDSGPTLPLLPRC